MDFPLTSGSLTIGVQVLFAGRLPLWQSPQANLLCAIHTDINIDFIRGSVDAHGKMAAVKTKVQHCSAKPQPHPSFRRWCVSAFDHDLRRDSRDEVGDGLRTNAKGEQTKGDEYLK